MSQKTAAHVLEEVRALQAGRHACSKALERLAGFTSVQRSVLRIVGQHPDISAGEIAGALTLHASTISGVLSRLQERGLLRRRLDPKDQRRATFRLTAAGRRHNRVRGGEEEAFAAALRGVSPSEIATTVAVLGKLRQALSPAEAAS